MADLLLGGGDLLGMTHPCGRCELGSGTCSGLGRFGLRAPLLAWRRCESPGRNRAGARSSLSRGSDGLESLLSLDIQDAKDLDLFSWRPWRFGGFPFLCEGRRIRTRFMDSGL